MSNLRGTATASHGLSLVTSDSTAPTWPAALRAAMADAGDVDVIAAEIGAASILRAIPPPMTKALHDQGAAIAKERQDLALQWLRSNDPAIEARLALLAVEATKISHLIIAGYRRVGSILVSEALGGNLECLHEIAAIVRAEPTMFGESFAATVKALAELNPNPSG